MSRKSAFATSHAWHGRKSERKKERERKRESGGREGEGDNKTTTANSYRFEILRNKVYIPGERYSI
jgi:hypothetical protein